MLGMRAGISGDCGWIFLRHIGGGTRWLHALKGIEYQIPYFGEVSHVVVARKSSIDVA